MIGSWYKVLDRLVVGGSKSAAMKKMLVDQVREALQSAAAGGGSAGLDFYKAESKFIHRSEDLSN